MGMVKEVIAEKVEHGCDAKHRAEQLRSLRQRRADQQPGIGTSENGELFLRRSTPANEPVGAGEKVIESSLTFPAFASLVPRASKLRSATNVGQREQTPALEKEADEHAELRSHRDSESSITRHDDRMAALAEERTTAHEEERNVRAVL